MSEPARPIARTTMLIRRAADEVCRAFTEPDITTKFWFNRASGPLVQGASVTWYWDIYGVSAQVDVETLDAPRRLAIRWPTPVEWSFEPRGTDATFVTITASGFTGTSDEAVARAIDSMGGFSFTLAACKAWLEHGVQLNIVADHNPDYHVAPGGGTP